MKGLIAAAHSSDLLQPPYSEWTAAPAVNGLSRAEQVRQKDTAARDAGGRLYVWAKDKGVYRPTGEWLVKREGENGNRAESKAPLGSNNASTKPLRSITEQQNATPLDTVNGKQAATGRAIKAASTTFASSFNVQFTFDPWPCPAIDEFVTGAPGRLQHIISKCRWLMLPQTSIRRSPLIGEGANGKSVFSRCLRDFLK